MNPIPYCDMPLEPMDPEAAVPQARPDENVTSPSDTPTHRGIICISFILYKFYQIDVDTMLAPYL